MLDRKCMAKITLPASCNALKPFSMMHAIMQSNNNCIIKFIYRPIIRMQYKPIYVNSVIMVFALYIQFNFYKVRCTGQRCSTLLPIQPVYKSDHQRWECVRWRNWMAEMEVYVKFIWFPYFLLFFWFSNMTLSDALILFVPQLQTQQVMTFQIRSHMYIIFNTDILYSYAHFLVEIDEKLSHIWRVLIWFNVH